MTSSFWVTIVATIIAASGLSFTVFSGTRAKLRKLTWATVYNTSILTGLPQNLAKDIRILSGAVELAKPRILVIELFNTGSVELKKEDIYLPVTVEVGVCRIVAANLVLRLRSAKIATRIPIARLTGTIVEAVAVVLNPGDSLVFELLVDGDNSKPGLTVQAAGFSCVELPTNSITGQTKVMTPRGPHYYL